MTATRPPRSPARLPALPPARPPACPPTYAEPTAAAGSISAPTRQCSAYSGRSQSFQPSSGSSRSSPWLTDAHPPLGGVVLQDRPRARAVHQHVLARRAGEAGPAVVHSYTDHGVGVLDGGERLSRRWAEMGEAKQVKPALVVDLQCKHRGGQEEGHRAGGLDRCWIGAGSVLDRCWIGARRSSAQWDSSVLQ